MNFTDLLPKKDAAAKDYYWALVIEPGWVQAGIWEIVEDKASVISVSPPASWRADEELINACDTALSAAVSSLEDMEIEPKNTVFGVLSSWVAEGQITDEHLEKIKRVCSELSLTPSGFVVLPEAIAHLVKTREGAPLNALVVGVGEETLELTVFKLGSLVGTTSVARSVSIADDVQEGLVRFDSLDLLPSRFILYDGKEGELGEDEQALLAFDWTDNPNVKFLHTPKIEIVSPKEKVEAVALAGASEIANVSGLAEMSETVPGEVEGSDVVPPQKGEEVSPADLGFVMGEDIAQTEAPHEAPMPPTLPSEPAAPIPARPFPARLPLLPHIPPVKTYFKGLVSKFPNMPKFAGIKMGSSRIKVGLVGLVVLLAGFFAFAWFYPKAEVTVYVSPKKVEDKALFLVDTQAGSPDISKSMVPGHIESVTVSGEKTKSTSGVKLVGDKAKGTVKIQNGTDSAIRFPAGTVIVSSGSLKFITDNAASISAALSPANPGTSAVDVTAADIGADFNLAKDESFKVGNYPKADVDAVSTANFSGGTSRQVSAVSADDQKTLEKEETDELITRAKGEILSQIPADKLLLEDSLMATPSSKSFSAKVGDEASTLKLALELKISGLTVDKSQAYDLAQNILKGKTPEGYALRNDQMTFRFAPKEAKNGVYGFDTTLAANLLPEVKPDDVAKKIAGKMPDAARNFLTGTAGFVRAEIKITPRLPWIFGTLPRIPSNISVSVSAE